MRTLERVAPLDSLRVRVPEHIALKILEQLETAGRGMVGGLLLGTLEDGMVRVERILPCRNQAPEADRGRIYDVAAEITANVARSIAGRPFRVIGRYCGGGEGAGHAQPSPRESGPGLRSESDLWLVARAGGEAPGELRLTAWLPGTAGGEPLEVGVDRVQPDLLQRIRCPD